MKKLVTVYLVAIYLFIFSCFSFENWMFGNKDYKAQAASPYRVIVDVSDQRVYVYKNYNLCRAMICSTGKDGYDTPLGSYKIKYRGEWFYSGWSGMGGKYWVGFIGTLYLVHSVPMDYKQNIIVDEAEKLGTPASHGCIRLSVDDAYWFYCTIPDGTKILIRD